MSNGCGCSSGWLKWFKPPMARYFYTACCMHDDDYDRGGGERQRKQADMQLFFNMLRIVQQRERNPFRAVFCAHIALLYYVSVRALGSRYFNYEKE